MDWIKKSLLVTLTCLGLSGCNFHSAQSALTLSNPTQQTATAVSSFDALKLNILDPKCLRCHGVGGEGGVDLSTYAAIMTNPGLATPGDLQKSRLYTEVFTGSMPEGGPVLNSDEVQAIANWIQAGTPNGDFGSNPPVTPPTTPPVTPPVPPTGSLYAQVQAGLFSPACVRCHSGPKPSGKVDLSSYQKIKANSKTVIIAGKPESSLAYTEIISGSMPPSGTAIDPKLIALLKTWITNGAKETD